MLSVLSHNKCAAGSGEFFIQQTGRMGLDMDEAIERSWGGKVVPLASRCSVHCKSDITHKLNRQEASVEDILHTLHDSMADKVVSLLEKGGRELKRVLLIGGVSRNQALVAALAAKLPHAQIVVLPESPYFEAWGAALLTRDEPLYRTRNISVKPSMRRLPPLDSYQDRVRLILAPRSPLALLVLLVLCSATSVQPEPDGACKCMILKIVYMMERVMAIEWASRGVRVNAIAPGYVQTEFITMLTARGVLDAARLAQRTPMGRIGTPDEIGEVAVFLASPAASFITYEILTVDGGWSSYGYL